MQIKFLRSLRLLAVATFALSFSSLAARAGAIGPLLLTVTNDGSQVSGSFVYHPDTQTYTGSFTFHDGSTPYTFLGSDFIGGGSGIDSYFWTFINSSGNALNLGYQPSTISVISPSLTQATLCSTAHLCDENMASAIYKSTGGLLTFDSGTLNIAPYAVAATPEPSSLALLGTGILGTVGAMRRRFRRA